MKPNNFLETVKQSPFIITEGSMFEALRRSPDVKLDDVLAHALLIYDEKSKKHLASLFRAYIDEILPHHLPAIVFTSTWRANYERLRSKNLENKPVNEDNAKFLSDIRAPYGDKGSKILIGGLMGCFGDAYKPEEALDPKASEKLHSFQAEKLAKGGVDFLFGSTLPSTTEAIGIAKAMAKTNLPYVLSFVIRNDGKVLDGVALSEAIQAIDSISLAPAFYMINCVHPKALVEAAKPLQTVAHRLLGIQGNTATQSVEELANSKDLITEDSKLFAKKTMEAAKILNLKILGGCCGTDPSHIHEIARLAASGAKSSR